MSDTDICRCGHVRRIHDSVGCRGVYNDMMRAGLGCTCQGFAAPPPAKSGDSEPKEEK